MSLQIKMSQKMSQSLMMTPQLQHAIKLLQMGRVEYIDAIHQELLENPVLEEVVDNNQDKKAKDGNQKEQEQATETPNPQKDESPVDWEDYLSSFSDYRESQIPKGTYDDEDRPPIEARLTKDESLQEHLLKQLTLSDYSDSEKRVIFNILGNLTSRGFLEASVEDLSKASDCAIEEVNFVLKNMQTLEPIGVCARDLKECLLIQLEYAGLGEALANKIVADHLEKIERRKYKEIAKCEEVAVEQVYEAIKLIQKLDPYPARQFLSEDTRYITPDIYVYKDGDEYVISLNEDGLPKLKIGSYYTKLLSKEKKTAKEKEYVEERVKAAEWLIKSIHQRQQTILKVTECIVKFQRDFFEKGIEHLKPLVLKDVASEIEMHESTVSRVTSNKYVHTPRGVFELKFFFRTGVKTKGGDELASSSIKQKIKKIVDSEDSKKPISDQKIVELLEVDGIKIARRTVAKYRESLGILSSSRRKKLF